MTRWHTDAPIPPVSAVRRPAPAAAVRMFRTDRAARVGLATAQAYFRRKLRTRPLTRSTEDPPAGAHVEDGFVV